jgi:hypothetical protein
MVALLIKGRRRCTICFVFQKPQFLLLWLLRHNAMEDDAQCALISGAAFLLLWLLIHNAMEDDGCTMHFVFQKLDLCCSGC